MPTLPRCFAPTAAASKVVTVSRDEAHHLTRVLRLRPGDGVGLFDGVGGEWVGMLKSVSPNVTVEIVDAAIPAPEPDVRVTLAIGVLKGAQMDVVVRDATMLGVFAIAPMATRHVSIARRGAPGGGALQRWQRVALASTRQCGRAVIPAVSPIVPFESVLAETHAEAILMGVEPDRLGDYPLLDAGPKKPTALVLIGPEGGWADGEIEMAVTRGARLVQLGPRTLRAEAAPIVALSSLWTQWGW